MSDRAAVLLLLGNVAFAAPAGAAVWLVKPDGTGDLATIQDAVAGASNQDVILLEDGTFTGSGNRQVDFLGKDVTVRSLSGSRSACVIDCEDASDSGFRFVSGEGPGAVLADLTVTSCASLALDVQAASPVIRNVVVRDGTLPMIEVEEGAPVLTGCLLESNTAPGSAVNGCTISSASATVERCRFVSNDVLAASVLIVRGGEINLRGCTFEGNTGRPLKVFRAWNSPDPHVDGTIEGCVFEGNRLGVVIWNSEPPGIEIRGCAVRGALSYGLQVIPSNGPIAVRDCTIEDNAGWGVRVHANPGDDVLLEACQIQGNGDLGILGSGNGTPVVRDCLITGNRGGIYTYSTSFLIEGSTLAFNDIGGAGGGVRFSGTNLEVRESIVWGNCPQDAAQIWTGPSSTTNLSCSVVQSPDLLASGAFLMSDVLDADPEFCSPIECAAVPSSAGIWGVAESSPVLGQPCGAIGWTQSTCAAVSAGAALEAASWGRVKAQYR